MEIVLIIRLVLGVGVIALLGAMVYVGLRRENEGDALEDRLASYGDRELDVQSLEEVELSLSFQDRILFPLVERLAEFTARFTPQKQLESSRRLIELAGLTQDPTQFFLTRIALTIVGGLFGMFVAFVGLNASGFQGLLWVGGGIVVGNYLPVLSLRSRISKRQQEIVKSLPDALDLLVICVEAGLGFDQAMGKVYEKWDNELALAFGRVLREIQLGKLRRVALKNMSDRMDVPDVNSFTAAIIQAEQLGVSMAKILRVQAEQMRIKRRQRAQEKAQQAPVKMMIPMVLLIFPSIWVILMGPAAIRIFDQFFAN
ncbi:MAG: type II secretion system F family protein [Phototrophicaceae bacterium]